MQKESVISNNDENSQQTRDDALPKVISINGKLFMLLLLSMIVIITMAFMVNSANERAETNTELMYVKMYPNGTWDVEFRHSGSEMDFFPLTVDKLIQDYVIARYGINPYQVRRDYGFAVIFMSPKVATMFIGDNEDVGQFNAPKKAEEYAQRGIEESVNIRFVDHFDVSTGTFLRGNSDVYRTNVFIERRFTDRSGQPKGESEKEVVNLHWRLKSKSELASYTRDQLRANPIGLEILKESIKLDHSSN